LGRLSYQIIIGWEIYYQSKMYFNSSTYQSNFSTISNAA